jgi:hypothetical protein
MSVSPGGPWAARERGGTSQVANFNLPQPYYQTTAYGPTFPPVGNHALYGVVLDTRMVRMVVALAPYTLNTDRVASGEMSDSVRDQVAKMLRELGFAPKGRAKAY